MIVPTVVQHLLGYGSVTLLCQLALPRRKQSKRGEVSEAIDVQ